MSLRNHPAAAGRRRLLTAAAAAVLTIATLATGPSAASAPVAGGGGNASIVAPDVYAGLADAETVEILTYLTEQADLSGADDLDTKEAKGTYVYEQLTEVAERTQSELRAFLDQRGAPHQAFWIVNLIQVEADAELVEELAGRDDVSHIELSGAAPLLRPIPDSGPTMGPQAVEWGVLDINADQAWNHYGVRGAGVVVATIDTGVRFTHTALVDQYRGNLGAGGFDHNYHWFDPTGTCPTAPCDPVSPWHGTHVTGTMVGFDGGANEIGVAPEAQWIAVKGCGATTCAFADLLAGGQWILAPRDLAGGPPDPAMAPHVVNNSWGGPGPNTFFQGVIQAWDAAGIYSVFANGNLGPGCGTAAYPANNIPAYGVGAYDASGTIAGFSSRGPSPIQPSIIRPNVSAPGVAIRSSVGPTDTSYGLLSGTSMAAPHVAGTVALIWSAAPWLAGFVSQTRSVLDLTARTVSDLSCGGVPAFNNVYGRGRVDALAAVSWLAGPRAAFTWSCNHLTLVCTFDGTGSVGSVAGWSWDFGDGGSGSGATVTHPYGASGDYDVTLTVTDVNGQSHNLTQTIRVGLIADFVHQCTRLNTHLVCGFDGSPSGPAPVISWDWDFGNGTVGSGMLVANLYQGGAGSSFNVTLTVTDTAGNTVSVTRPVP